MTKTRAVRFSADDEHVISKFLTSNPIFDFSTLARTAILTFVNEPKLKMKAVKRPTLKETVARG